MSPLAPVGFRAHLQDDFLDCGLACVQMVREACGMGLTEQGTLKSQTSPDPPWSTSPKQVRDLLAGVPSPPYEICEVDRRSQMNSAIIGALQTHKRPPVALVQKGGHWMVVIACEGGTGPGIKGLLLADPSPDLAGLEQGQYYSPPPAPHGSADDCQALAGQFASFPVSVSWYGWQKNYQYAPCSVQPHVGKFVVVCPRAPTPSVPPDSAAGPPPASRDSSGDPRDTVVVALGDHGLDQVEPWRTHLASFKPEEPVEIGRLDGEPSLLLVPLMQRDSGILAVLDAESRAYLQSAVVSRALVETLRTPPATLYERAGRPLGLPSNDWRAGRVWQPCKESTTPLRPFMRFETDGRAAFVRLFDGRVFQSLTVSAA